MQWTPLTEPDAHQLVRPYYFGGDDAAAGPPKKCRSRNQRTARTRTRARARASALTDDSIRIPFAAIAQSVSNAVDKAMSERDRKPVLR
ncbi:hypothetical protein GQ607_016376 [Colletotrichum asianum]|uniref:Uncharacterized protein n=1 Tax=Colletotrichum asianum TaxID=702518 RepID=A0A8H3VYS3_9PEZI|nr:hypothetical protein GQ607_016376 [Colletotrichum asianum]